MVLRLLPVSLVPVSLVLLCALSLCTGFHLEKPDYVVLQESSDFEIRLYNESVWAVALVEDVSFVRATTLGFHRLFEYIEGGNYNWTRVPMTAPVLTGIIPSAGPFCSSAFAVRFFIPAKFQKAPPTPLAELDITFERWGKKTIAVRKFSGYAQDSNVAQEAEKLAKSLAKTDSLRNATFPISGLDSYAIAQFNSPFQIWDRLNEVWVNIDLDSSNLSTQKEFPVDRL